MKALLLPAVVAAVLAAAGTAAANSPGYTRGDAEAVFNAGATGGDVLTVHGGLAEGAPAQPGLRIRPFQTFNGMHVCALDWHVVNTVLHVAGDATYSHEQAVADLSPFVAHYTLDGAPLESTVTAVKRWPTPELVGYDVGYWRSYGAVLSPDALAVGQHTIRLVIDNFVAPGVPEDFGDVTFFVDAEGTGVCI
jgi:hypothetical protein